MKGLDTNILVRFLANDDKKQAARVKKLFEAAELSGERFVVPAPVVLELLWVLTAVYEYPREAVLNALEQMTLMPILNFEDPERIYQLINLGRTAKTDLPDILIGLSAQSLGCENTLTFNKKAAGSELFTLL